MLLKTKLVSNPDFDKYFLKYFFKNFRESRFKSKCRLLFFKLNSQKRRSRWTLYLHYILWFCVLLVQFIHGQLLRGLKCVKKIFNRWYWHSVQTCPDLLFQLVRRRILTVQRDSLVILFGHRALVKESCSQHSVSQP